MKSIIFDWDGTLLDSDYLIDQAIYTVCNELNRHDILQSVEHLLFRERSSSLLRALRLPALQRENFIKLLSERYAALENEALLFPGISDLLAEFKTSGLGLHVVTGSERGRFDAKARHLGVRKFFDITVCRGEAQRKPNREAATFISDAGFNKTVVVGNSSIDELFAKEAGLRFVGVSFCKRTIPSKRFSIDVKCAVNSESLKIYLEKALNE